MATNFDDLLRRADTLLGNISAAKHDIRLVDSTLNTSSILDPLIFDQTKREHSVLRDHIQQHAKPGTSILWSNESDLKSGTIRFPSKLKTALDLLPDQSSVYAKGKQLASTSDQCFEDNDESELENFLRNERENVLISLIEETMRTTAKHVEERALKMVRDEWEDKKKKLMPTVPTFSLPETKPNVYFPAAGLAPKTSMTNLEACFSQAVSDYIDRSSAGGIPVKMIDLFCRAVEDFKSEKFIDLWQQVKFVLDCQIPLNKTVEEVRKSLKFKLSSISQALKYLEKQFLRHMQMIVYGNLEQGLLGGVPGILNLIKAFLNVKLPNGYQGCEDGFLNGHPIWATIYHCMRAGDFQAAYNACTGNESEAVAEFGNAVKELQKLNTLKLSSETETRLVVLWRTVGRASQDPFKRASFCVLFLCDVLMDHSEVADKFEDWLWIKLRQALLTESLEDLADSANTTSKTPSSALRNVSAVDLRTKLHIDQLKNQIIIDYGEKHFAAGDSPLLFWTALWLTGQFEAAIDFLYRQQHRSPDYRCHALHIALTMHESGLLLIPADSNSKILSLASGGSNIDYRLNLARLLILYVTQFQTGDLKEALNYLYFLKDFKSTDGENLFYMAIRDILLETKEYELLLGRLDERGIRLPGLIDSSRYGANSLDLIRFVAADAEKRGLMETAVGLYDLCMNHTKVLEILISCLCQVASQPSSAGSKRERFVSLATRIAVRFRDLGYKADESIAVTFFQLMDIVTFFDLFHDNNFNGALEVIRRTKLLPLDNEEVDRYAKEFFMVSDEVRRILPEMLLACMSMLSAQYKQAQETENSLLLRTVDLNESLKDIRNSAKALVQYAALIPYRMPGDTAARLVQMETFMH